jgi:hypothetical protein
MDIQTLGVIAGVVAVVAIVLYVWERRTKQQPIEWVDAAKLAVGASGVAGGVAYAVGGPDDALGAIQSVAETAQEMFVGKPGF